MIHGALLRLPSEGSSPLTGWISEIEDEWPGPIAHEYHVLRMLIQEADRQEYAIAAAVLQFRDVVETLIKLPAVIMLCDLARHDPRSELLASLREQLLCKPPSLGDWWGVADQLAMHAIKNDAGALPYASRVARLFRTRPTQGNPKPTNLAKQIRGDGSSSNPGLITWRNQEIGHGALRLETEEIRDDLLARLRSFNEALKETCEAGPWNGLRLSAVHDAKSADLTGHTAIRTRHDGLAPSDHRDVSAGLIIECDDLPSLDLAPWVAARCCNECSKRDIFVFNTRRMGKHVNRCQYLDYLTGHQTSEPQDHDPAWQAEVGDLATIDPEDMTGSTDAPFLPSVTAQLLEDTSAEREFLPPEYLNTHVRRLIQDHPSGAFLLRAPAHTGKTVFASLLDNALSDADPIVVTLHIRREFRFTEPQWNAFLERELLEKKLGQQLQVYDLPWRRPGGQSSDPAAGFLEFLRTIIPLHCDRPLVICLDGLDELPDSSGQRSILDFIPAPSDLPENSYLVLTCRLPEGTADWINQRLADRVIPSLQVGPVTVHQDDPEYVALMRQYLETNLRPDVARADTDALFNAVHDRAEGTFLYFAHIVRLIADQVVRADAAAIDMLPSGPALFDLYLRRIRNMLGPKHAALLERVLVTLAAAEEAHDALVASQIIPAGYIDPDWKGLPLDLLADLLDDAGSGGTTDNIGVSLRLVFALQSIREVLRSFRGGKGTSRHQSYRIGLKGLKEAMRTSKDWGGRIDAIHGTAIDAAERELSPDAARNGTLDVRLTHFVEGWAGHVLALDRPLTSFAERAIGETTFHHANRADHQSDHRVAVIGHSIILAAFAEPANVSQQDGLASACLYRGTARENAGDLAGAMVDYDQVIGIREQLRDLLGNHWPPVMRDGLAIAYVNRGNVRAKGIDLVGAIKDYDRAIAIREVHADDELTSTERNSLALAYMGRGSARYRGNDLNRAIADHNRAIDLMEQTRALLGDQWPPSMCDALAGAYTNRGNARDLVGAIEDYGQAIDLRENLRSTLSEQWTPGLTNDLAGSYRNRGAAHDEHGHPTEAIGDYGHAIELGEHLCAQLQDRCTPAMLENLAATYMNRGNTRLAIGKVNDAIADYNLAINHMEHLRDHLFQQWPPSMRNDLVLAHMNRGNAQTLENNLSGALDDLGIARAIAEALRDDLGDQWPPAFQVDLAKVLSNRAVALDATAQSNDARQDLLSARDLLLNLKAALRPQNQWHPQWQALLDQIESRLNP